MADPALIHSSANPKVKFARSLRQRKQRTATGLFLVEGLHHIGEAVEAGADLHSLYYAPDLLESEFARRLLAAQRAAGVPAYALTPEVLETLADKDNPQGLVAVAHLPLPSLESFSAVNFPWGVALVAPQDPGNVGSILRTIDAVGAGGLLLLDSHLDVYHPALVRASMGALFRYPPVQASFADFHRWAQRHGYLLLGTSARGSLDYRALGSLQPPLILLLGSEQKGLSPEQIAACAQLVRLPMHGRVSSLNLSVAAGVLLYALLDRLAASAAPSHFERGAGD